MCISTLSVIGRKLARHCPRWNEPLQQGVMILVLFREVIFEWCQGGKYINDHFIPHYFILFILQFPFRMAVCFIKE